MRTMLKSCVKFLLILPAISIMISCKSNPYISDNKKRMRKCEAKRTKYEVPGQARVKTGNHNDGY